MQKKRLSMTIRIYHSWDKWECFKNGLYDNQPKFIATENECLTMYAEFLEDDQRFWNGMCNVASNWINSCEHFLTNESMNRIAWLGQSAMCIETGVPNKYRSGFYLLSTDSQLKANNNAKKFLDRWISEQEKNIALHKNMGISRLL
jgi:hypothetical protein